MKFIIVIPAYNEAKNVPKLVEEINELGYEYIVINDCSTDNSKEVYDKLNINYLDLPLNLGLASVTQAGFRYALDKGYDCAIVLDGDGQHPPKYISKVIGKIEEGYDYAVGSRYLEKKKPWNLRMLGSRIFSLAIKIKTGKKVTDSTSGMRACGKKVLKEFDNNMNFIAEPDALVYLIKKKYKTCEVQVDMEERIEGESYFTNIFKAAKFVFNVVVSIIFIM